MSSAPPDPPSTPERHGSIRAILVNAGWMLGGKGVSALLSTIYLALATRSLGVEGFAQFALALGIAQTVSGLISFQSWQIVVRYGMPHLHAGDHFAIGRLLRFATLLDVGGAIAGTLLSSAGFLLLGPRFGWTPEFTRQALLATIALILSVHSTPTGILRLYDRFGVATAADTVTPVVRFVGALIAWIMFPTPIAFLIAWSVAEFLTAAAYWLLASRLPDLRLRRQDGAHFMREENPGILRYALITNLSSSLALGGRQVAVLLVGLVVTPAAAGGFRLAQQLSTALAKLSQTLARAVFPELMRSAAASTDGQDVFHRLFARTMRLGAIGGAVVIVLLLTIGKPALGLIAGPAFLGSYPVLLLLGIGAAIDFAALSFEPALTAQGRAGTALALRCISTAIMLGGMIVLAELYAANGAAGAILIASLISFVLMARAVGVTPRSG